MENLTTREQALISGINRHTKAMDLGEKMQNVVDKVKEGGFNSLIEATPVNAVNADETLTLTGDVLHGETVTINNPANGAVDIYEFLTDDAQVLVNGNIAIPLLGVDKATGTLTVDTQPTAGDTMTIGAKEYTFVPNGTANADGEISVGEDLAEAKINIVYAINGFDEHNTLNPEATAGMFAINDSTITATVAGTAGNSIVTTETFAAGTNGFTAGTLSGGTDATVKATGTLTIDTQPISGDTMTIGDKEYIFVPDGTANADGEISVGTDLATSQANIVSAINGTDGHNIGHAHVYAEDFSINDCVLTAFVGGTLGNAIDTTETFTEVTNIFSAATLVDGEDCSAANAITSLLMTIAMYDTQYIAAEPGAGTTVVISSQLAGESGNSIEIQIDMANGSVPAEVETLSGGVDGSVASEYSVFADSDYLYVSVGPNTVSDKNWRRIAVGNAY